MVLLLAMQEVPVALIRPLSLELTMLRVVTLAVCMLYWVSAGPVPGDSDGAISSSQSHGEAAPGRDIVTWNQSQHGKYNVHVSLKDVKIIAVINSDYYDDDDDTDYEYDYEDLEEGTNKPTPSGISEEEVDEETSTSSATSESTTVSTATPQNTSEKSQTEQRPPVLLTFVTDGKPENITQLPTDPVRRNTLYQRNPPRAKATPKTPVDCEPGFIVDILGRCRRIRRRRPSYFPFKFNFPGFSDLRLARRQAAKKQQLRQQLQQMLVPHGRGWQHHD
ncbi:hypothetical protein B566_EDAN012119 [Ephemera danica]|nr:hypothetical protein B566_EDAN012119 [Ephemera danica]